jgi:hypothetical protein
MVGHNGGWVGNWRRGEGIGDGRGSGEARGRREAHTRVSVARGPFSPSLRFFFGFFSRPQSEPMTLWHVANRWNITWLAPSPYAPGNYRGGLWHRPKGDALACSPLVAGAPQGAPPRRSGAAESTAQSWLDKTCLRHTIAYQHVFLLSPITECLHVVSNWLSMIYNLTKLVYNNVTSKHGVHLILLDWNTIGLYR